MGILAQCPRCGRKLGVSARACKCGGDMDREKRNRKVRYYIIFRDENKKQVWRSLASFEGCDPFSIEDARKVEAKYNVCKTENKLDVFDVRPEGTMTFRELSDWYLELPKVKALKSYKRSIIALNRFNEGLGHKLVRDIKPVDLETYQSARKGQGKADATVDQEIATAKSVVRRAFDNDPVSGKVFKTFGNVGKLLKTGANVRDRVLTVTEADILIENAPGYLKAPMSAFYETGMRRSEVFGLCWDAVSMKDKLISLGETKNGRPRVVPMTERLFATLKAIPRDFRDRHVFLLRGNPMADIRCAIQGSCEKAGIGYGRSRDGFTLHSLRHTVNTDLRKAGVQESVINALIGHVDNSMFGRYNTIDLEDLRQAMTRLEVYRDSVRLSVRQTAQAG